jgi:SAM-dependent methyltransferase
MHPSAMNNAAQFFDTYSAAIPMEDKPRVIDIGAQDVNGSLRQVTPPQFEYVGLDFQKAKGVDILLEDPYVLPLADASVDIALSSSCFEHSEMFWVVFLEVMRVLKPTGLFYLNAPSAGSFHRYPVDCWRFYPDSGKALISWGKRNGLNPELLESFTQIGGRWQDYIAVFLKDSAEIGRFPARILDRKKDFENGQRHGDPELLNQTQTCQNDRKLDAIGSIAAEKMIVR